MLGQTLLILHQEEEAVHELRTAVELEPDSPLAHHFLGTALFNSQNFQAAETEFRQAVRLQPSASNHYYLAACLMNLGRYDEALAELDTAAEMEPSQSLYRARKEELEKLIKAGNR